MEIIVLHFFLYMNSVLGLCLLLGDTALNINLSFDLCRWLVEGEDVEDTVYSSIARYRLEEPVSVSGSCTGTSSYTGRPERPEYGLRQRKRPTCRDVKGSGACLRHHTTS